MAKKRGNGEGTIYKRPNGQWAGQITVRYDGVTGKLQRKTVYGKTRKEVKSKLDEIRINMPVINQYSLLGEWLDVWLDEYYKQRVSEQTMKRSKQLITNHIKPGIGNTPLYGLDTYQVQLFYSRLSKRGRLDGQGGLSYNTVRIIHATLKAALNQAVLNKYIPNNPSLYAKLPKKHIKKKPTLGIPK